MSFLSPRRRVGLAWIAFAVLAFLALLFAQLPARFVLSRAVDPSLGVSFSGITGTVWNGHASEVTHRGKAVGSLDWRLSPWALLRGAKRLNAQLAGAGFSGSAQLESNGSRVRVENADIHFPATGLASALDVPSLEFSGDVNVKIDVLELENNLPVELAGQAAWRNAAVSGAAQATLGTLTARFSGSNGNITGTLADAGDGALQLSGQFTINPLGYKANATLRARGENPQLREALQFIGQPRGDGSVEYNVEGGWFGGGK